LIWRGLLRQTCGEWCAVVVEAIEEAGFVEGEGKESCFGADLRGNKTEIEEFSRRASALTGFATSDLEFGGTPDRNVGIKLNSLAYFVDYDGASADGVFVYHCAELKGECEEARFGNIVRCGVLYTGDGAILLLAKMSRVLLKRLVLCSNVLPCVAVRRRMFMNIVVYAHRISVFELVADSMCVPA
jgi:hypothetical protein